MDTTTWNLPGVLSDASFVTSLGHAVSGLAEISCVEMYERCGATYVTVWTPSRYQDRGYALSRTEFEWSPKRLCLLPPISSVDDWNVREEDGYRAPVPEMTRLERYAWSNLEDAEDLDHDETRLLSSLRRKIARRAVFEIEKRP